MSNKIGSSWGGVFNPLSSEFREADRIFHTELFDYPGRRAAIVIASIFGSLFFIVGAFPVFCWTVELLRPTGGSKEQTISDVAARTFPPAAAQSVGQAGKTADIREIYCVRGSRWERNDFQKFLGGLRSQGLTVHELNLDSNGRVPDMGKGKYVVVLDYWGREGGKSLNYGKGYQSKLVYLTGATKPILFTDLTEESPPHAYFKYDLDHPFKNYESYSNWIKQVCKGDTTPLGF